MQIRWTISLSALLAVAGLLVLLSSMAFAQDSRDIQFAQTVGGEVTTRFGEEWTFEGCAGDVVTVTMTSTEYTVKQVIDAVIPAQAGIHKLIRMDACLRRHDR